MNKTSVLLVQTLSKSCASVCMAALSAVAVLALVGPASAANFTTTTSQASGANWTAAIWGGTAPTAGNTYELISNGTAWGNNTGNTRVRTPLVDGLVQFPGDSLKLNTNTDIRFKQGTASGGIANTISYFPGVGGSAGLILNGGVLNPADDSVFIVTGRVQVTASSVLSGGDVGGGAQKETRAAYLRGVLTGTGDLRILQSGQGAPHRSDADASGYSGNWIIQNGFLRGLVPVSGANSLGTGSILLMPTNTGPANIATNLSKFEPMYDLNTPGSLVLSNNTTSGSLAVVVLHQNLTFSSVNVNGTLLTVGTHPYAELAASFPNNFTGGSGSITVQPPAPPPAPAVVSAINGDAQVFLSWTASANAAGYLIKRSGTHLGPYTTVGSSGTTNATDTGLINGSTYYYVIVATNSLGASGNSPEVIGQPNPVVVGITAVGGTGQVALAWTALPNIDSYSVNRSTSSTGAVTVVASGLTGTSYLDTAVANGTTYFYRISAAITGGGVSGRSAQVSATTAPSTPSLSAVLFAATIPGQAVIRLGWTKPDPVVSQYLVDQSPDGVNFTPLATQPGSNPSYTNTGLALNTAYYYRVQAQNSGGFSGYSPTGSVTTPTQGWNINFGAGESNSANAGLVSPIPPGYLGDIGDYFGDRTNGFFYGWTNAAGTNLIRDTRWRRNGISPDLRYDTFVHLMKANTGDPNLSATWEFQIPNGFYWVHIVCGESDNGDPNTDHFQFNVEGNLTPLYLPATTPPLAHWGEFTNTALVSDGALTIKSGPLALNNKITFIDIYPAIAVPIMVTADPQSPPPVLENRPLSMSVAIAPVRPLTAAYEGYLPVFYQWYQDTGSGFAPVTDATNATLSMPLAQLGNAGTYYAVVTNFAGSVTSLVATVTVLPDNDPPVLVSAGSVDGKTVGVCFDELLNTNSIASALDYANYLLTDSEGAVFVSSGGGVTLRPDGKSVQLVLDLSGRGPLHGAFTVSCFADDFKGTADAQSGSGKVSGLTPMDVGYTNAPPVPGLTYSCKDGEFDVLAGGIDIWGNVDQGHMALQSRSNEWDVIVRVQSLTIADAISKAGLMARQSFDSNSPAVYLSVNPPPPGRDLGEAGMRTTVGGATAAWPTNSASTNTTYAPAGIPNAWQRMKRSGNLMTASRSTNGVDWVVFAQVTNTSIVDPMLVGLATTGHNGTNGTTKAQYRNFHFVDGPTILSSPTSVTSAPAASASFTVSASGSAEGGPLVYQWRKNGVDIPGATAPTYAIASVQATDAGSYDARAMNSGGRAYSAAALLVLPDTTPPVLFCPGPLAVQCPGPVTFTVTATDNVDVAVSVSCIPASGSVFAVGPTTVICSASDAAHNTGTCSFTVTVADTIPPVVTVPANISTACTGGGGASVSFTATATDNCNGSRPVLCLPASGSPFSLGTTLVRCSATDTTGNSSTNTFTVAVVDTAPPVLTCPPNITTACTGSGSATVTYPVTATDVCSGSRPVICTPSSGSTFSLGTVTVNCSAMDTAGQTGTCSFTVTVRDTTPPIVTCPANITTACTGSGSATVTYPATATDECSGSRPVICTPSSGSTFNLGTATVTCTATDTAGNTGTNSFTVTVTDTTPPVVTCPANLTTACTGGGGASVSFTATATDTCSGSRPVTCVPASGSTFNLGTTTVTCTATDTSSNTGTNSFTVTVQDTTAPVVTCPANITTACTGGGGASVSFTATATDGCSGSRPVTCVPSSGSTFSLGTATVNCSATDAAGNIGTCSFTVTVVDTSTPSINCPGNMTVVCVGGAGAPAEFAATATGGCTPPTVSCVPPSGSSFPLGSSTVTCTATGASGNTAQCSFTVTAEDHTVPSLSIARSGPNAVISWPVTCTAYEFQETGTLGQPGGWVASGASVQVVDGRYQTTVPTTGRKFYRLAPRSAGSLVAALANPDGAMADAAYGQLYSLGAGAIGPLIQSTSPSTSYAGSAFQNPRSSIVPMEDLPVALMKIYIVDGILRGHPAPHYAPTLLSAGPEDPSTLLASATIAYQQWWLLHQGQTLDQMRAAPGPLNGLTFFWYGPILAEALATEGTKAPDSSTPAATNKSGMVICTSNITNYAWVFQMRETNGPAVYNCLAWAVNCYNDRWVQPGGATLKKILEDHGYTFTPVDCAGKCPDSKGPKVKLVYNQKGGVKTWVHAMKQQDDGKWTSKNGQSDLYTDIVDCPKFLDEHYPVPTGATRVIECYCK